MQKFWLPPPPLIMAIDVRVKQELMKEKFSTFNFIDVWRLQVYFPEAPSFNLAGLLALRNCAWTLLYLQ
jgi:hypothetical protein